MLDNHAELPRPRSPLLILLVPVVGIAIAWRPDKFIVFCLCLAIVGLIIRFMWAACKFRDGIGCGLMLVALFLCFLFPWTFGLLFYLLEYTIGFLVYG